MEILDAPTNSDKLDSKHFVLVCALGIDKVRVFRFTVSMTTSHESESNWQDRLAIPTVKQLRRALFVGDISIAEFNLLAVRIGAFGVVHTLDEVAEVYGISRQQVRSKEVRALVRCQSHIKVEDSI